MADSVLELLFSADTNDLDKAKEKLADLGGQMPTIGEGIESLAKSFLNLPGPIGLAAAAAIGLGTALVEMISRTTEAGQQLLELSDAVGISVEKLQPLITVLNMSGISSEQAQRSMQKLAVSVGEALSNPTGKAADEFRKLGISQEELKKGDLSQILSDTAAGFAKYADSAEKTAAMRDLLSRQGPQIVGALADEKAATAAAKETMDQYGATVTTADAILDKKFNSTISLSMQMFTGLGNTITKSMLPSLQLLADWFVESGKQGGAMREILDEVGAVASWLGKVLIETVAVPVMMMGAVWKEAAVAIRGSSEAIKLAVHGNFTDAKNALVAMNDEINRINNANRQAISDLDDSLSGLTPVLITAKKLTTDAGSAFGEYDANARKVSDTLVELATKLVAQHQVWDAAGQSLEAYKKAEDDVAIAAERLKIAKEGGKEQAQDEAEALMRAANADKQATTERLAGLNLQVQLEGQLAQITTHASEVEKTEAAIKKNNLDVVNSALATQLRLDAQDLDNKNQSASVTKLQNTLDEQANAYRSKELTSLTMSNVELARKNELEKIHAQYIKDTENKEPAEKAKITAAYDAQIAKIKEINAATDAEKNSMQGLRDGAVKNLTDMRDQMSLYNQGQQAATQMTNLMTTALTSMGSGAAAAFKALLVGILQYIEQQVIKFALVQAELAILADYGITGPAAASIVGGTPKANANGGVFGASVTPHADGGIVSSQSYFMASNGMNSMAEHNIPEAIMPLGMTQDGKVGVHIAGNSGGGGGDVHNHHNTFVINSNQPAADVAKQAKKATTTAAKFTKQTMSQQKRPGGILAAQPHAFAR